MKRLLAAVLSLTPALSFAQGPKVIYGEDNRLDLYQVESPQVRRLADSTVALFYESKIQREGDGAMSRLLTNSYAQSYSLCQGEPFRDQGIGAFCSGSLVGPDLVMTAGHCVRTQQGCDTIKFVFGFALKEKGRLPETVPTGDIYGCSKLLGRAEAGSGPDWALIKLDRRVVGHKPLEINRAGTIEKETPLIVIGHPAGLPTKIAGGAKVRDPNRDGYFVTNLDTYGGNSGSAVFNARNGLVEGILVRGEQDFTYKDGCYVSNVCAADGCRGEDVTKVSVLASQVPASDTWTLVKTGASFGKLLDMAGTDAR